LPAPGIPLLYFAYAHGCLALAFGILLARPDLPGGMVYHPRMIAVVHLVTLGWISGSILGAFYIVAPLVLRMPLRPGWRDRAAFGSFALGASGIIAHFWIGEYSGMVWSAVLVAAAVLHVALRAWRGLRHAPVPGAVTLHVSLAFANMLLASVFGMVIGLNRLYGWWPWSPMSAAFGHAHLAAVGWALMMVAGLSYRLVPMIVPAEMPAGRTLAISAVLMEVGVLWLAIALPAGSAWTPVAALVIVAGIASFIIRIRRTIARKRPAPPALPRPDWATWQTHTAFGWLLVATGTGLTLTLPIDPAWIGTLRWIYGTAGLAGFLAQIVLGIQGRLLPLYGWYRLMEQGGLQPPDRAAHSLASHGLSKGILICWALGVPLLTAGLATDVRVAIAIASGVLLAGVLLNAAQLLTIVTGRRAINAFRLRRGRVRA
jgi:hypothetical protein